MLCENISDNSFKDVFSEKTIIRFTVNAGKYMIGLVTGTVECKTPYMVTYQKHIGIDKATKKPIVKEVQEKCNFEILYKLGDNGIFLKSKKTRICNISNGLITENELSEFRNNFESRSFPFTREEVMRKARFISDFINGKLTARERDDLKLFQIEKKIKKKEFHGFNFLLEKSRIQIMLKEIEELMCKSTQESMFKTD